jgi:tRNA G18 (ribose-2'-O)-methylase SpoU
MNNAGPTIYHLDSLDDPRAEAYRNVKDRELARLGDRFLAEGELATRRLLASDYPVESVLVAEKHVAEIAPLMPPGAVVLAATDRVVSGILGFPFHSGIIGCGRRKPAATVDEVAAGWADPVTLMVLPEVTNTENLGALLRIASAFGVAAVVLGPRSCDPFYRQSIRVSMGEVFRLTLVRSADLTADLVRLRDRWGVELAATVLADGAEPLSGAGRGARLALLFGNEAQGLRPEEVALCSRRVTIPMKLGTDSLNVAVAAGVFLYHFTRPGRGPFQY